MERKEYKAAQMELILLDSQDTITTSYDEGEAGSSIQSAFRVSPVRMVDVDVVKVPTIGLSIST